VVTPRRGEAHHVVTDDALGRRLEPNTLQDERVVFVEVAQALEYGKEVSTAVLPSMAWLQRLNHCRGFSGYAADLIAIACHSLSLRGLEREDGKLGLGGDAAPITSDQVAREMIQG